MQYDKIRKNIGDDEMKLKNITVQIGGFHDHWLRNGTENPTLLMAAMEYLNYDFICLLDNMFEKAEWEKKVIEEWMPGVKVYLGEEVCYDWGHIVSIENTCKDYNFEKLDWRSELKKIHEGGGFVALAHIGYPFDRDPAFNKNEINELIEDDYVDAVQLERVTDWELVEKRAKDGKKLPLVGGWDAHYLLNTCDEESNLYTKKIAPGDQIDSAPGMRTIVFAEDASLESLKAAIRDGKSVLEHVETGELFGSPELVDLLVSEGYIEKMREHQEKYVSLELENEVLTAFKESRLKFPGCGEVWFAGDSRLSKKIAKTDENGYINIEGIPMPAMHEKNYVPFYWKGETGERLWAVKILNNISIKVYPDIFENERAIVVEAKNDLKGKIKFTKPICCDKEFNVKKGESVINLKLPVELDDVFDCEFVVEASEGGEFAYKKRFGVAVAESADTEWSECHKYFLDAQEYCGGFGSNRPYPGKDVFSGYGQFKWDEKYLYFRCDIVDGIHIPPPSGAVMYLADCTCISFDSKLNRSKTPSDTSGVCFGFPEEGPELNVGGKNILLDGDGDMSLEETDYGRIVTVKIPWKDIKVENPHKGMVIGLHFSFLNNNGTGLLDNLNWPSPAPEGRMEQPEDYGTLYLK